MAIWQNICKVWPQPVAPSGMWYYDISKIASGLRENESLVHVLERIINFINQNEASNRKDNHFWTSTLSEWTNVRREKTSKELHGMVETIHSRQIDGVYLKLSQTKGKDGLLIDESIETNIDTRNCCRGKCNNQSHKNINTIFKFNSEWESGWNPKKNTSRIFSCLK